MTTTIPEFHVLCFSASTWNTVFDVFLTRSENAKAKPTRHLLVTLNKILSKNRNTLVAHSIKSSIIVTLVNIVSDRESQVCVKPALQALDHFVTKHTIRFLELLFEFNKVSKKESEHSSLTEGAARIHDPTSLDLSVESLPENAAQIFNNILYWMSYPEIAPIAGRLFTSISKNYSATIDNGLPQWYHPLYRTLESNPSLMDVFETQLLPDLLQFNLGHTVAFLKVLPYNEIQKGLAGHRKLAEILLCLVSLRIAQNLKLDRYPGKIRPSAVRMRYK